MKTSARIDWDESSFDDTAKTLLMINNKPWSHFKRVRDFVEYMKSQTEKIMLEKEDKHFTHWGTGGFYVTVFPSSGVENEKNPMKYHAHATLMPFSVAGWLGVRSKQ